MPFELRSLFCCIPYLRLEVAGGGAVQRPDGVWVANYAAGGGSITITAYTTVGTPIVWAIANGAGAATPGGDQYNVPLNNAANVNPVGTNVQVTATAGPLAQTVDIEVKPFLVNLGVDQNHYAFQDAGAANAWYAYDLSVIAPGAVRTANLRATIQPATANALGHLQWAATTVAAPPVAVALTPVAPGIEGIPLNAVRTVRVAVGVAGSNQPVRQLTVDVRAPGNGVLNLQHNLGVQLDQFTFAGAGRFDVTQEDVANFNNAYGANWVRNPAASPPQGYAANNAIALNAVTVSVTQVPNNNSNLQARASIYFPQAAGGLTVLQAATAPAVAVPNATVLATAFNLGNLAMGNVPNEVMVNEPLLIFWEANNGGGWQPLAVTATTVYVTAQAPVASTWLMLNSVAGPVFTYLSLLDISCRAARGQAGGAGNIANVKTAIYGAFNPPPLNPNPNANVVRLNPPAGPATQLRYWWNHANASPAQTLNQRGAVVPAGLPPPNPPLGGGGDLFNNPHSNIACGVWANLLVAMWAQHGDANGTMVGVWVRSPASMAGSGHAATPNVVNNSRFLVRRWGFDTTGLATNAGNYTHPIVAGYPPGVNQASASPVAGQNNANPPPQFRNHYIVLDTVGGNYYDPSYGAAPANRNGWVTGGLAGLRNDATNTAGFTNFVGPAVDNVNPNVACVALRNLVTGAWVP